MKKLKKNISVLLVAFIATFFMSQNAYAYTGIDISAYNENVNFNAVSDDGVKAVIIKATEGVDWQDSMFNTYSSRIQNSGVEHIGYYHFLSERTSPSEQARDFYNAIKNKHYDIMPCLDVETNNYGRSESELTNRCLEFIQTFKELSGQNVMIYSGAYFARDNLDFRIKMQPLWVASYGRSPIPTGFVNVVGWQYTETGSINGIGGYVDVNEFNDGMLLSNGNIVPQTPPVNTNNDNIYSQLQEELNRQGFGNLDVDGIPGPLTLAACPLVKEGAKGNITQWIQLRVGANPDGKFGVETKDAVIGFQYSMGISADGIVGRNTWSKLLGI
ncbi:GH25 family lysozyme [Clostridium sp. HBUAS56017]|uniref:GH25 family lysozyme n=1 Tax=Clostridium sp. HBUAS56017 TaxID=2571128 RepID=UPI001178138C|nr:GH25 family lysozyme [Clostridium sp. HBUAS56017]